MTALDRVLVGIDQDKAIGFKLVAMGKESTDPFVAHQIELVKEGTKCDDKATGGSFLSLV